jgi:alpha-tubulin suppressor-like RCC1 family protein
MGNGMTAASSPPNFVFNRTGTDLLGGVRQISASDQATCAVVVGATVRCWGEGTSGQLGNGQTDTIHLPVTVVNATQTRLSGVAGVSVGSDFACARLTNGQARCWGEVDEGQLGNGQATDTTIPVATPVLAPRGGGPLTAVTQLATSDFHTCVRLSTGQARCWGLGVDGRLGNGGNASRARPVPVTVG